MVRRWRCVRGMWSVAGWLMCLGGGRGRMSRGEGGICDEEESRRASTFVRVRFTSLGFWRTFFFFFFLPPRALWIMPQPPNLTNLQEKLAMGLRSSPAVYLCTTNPFPFFPFPIPSFLSLLPFTSYSLSLSLSPQQSPKSSPSPPLQSLHPSPPTLPTPQPKPHTSHDDDDGEGQ